MLFSCLVVALPPILPPVLLFHSHLLGSGLPLDRFSLCLTFSSISEIQKHVHPHVHRTCGCKWSVLARDGVKGEEGAQQRKEKGEGASKQKENKERRRKKMRAPPLQMYR